MNRTEKWAAGISSVIMAAMLSVAFPDIKAIMLSIVSSSPPEYGEFWGGISELAMDEYATIRYKVELDNAESNLPSASGLLQIVEDPVNVRSSPGIREDNIIAKTNRGEIFAYYGTAKADNMTWFQIYVRDSLQEGWVSRETFKLIAQQDGEIIEDELADVKQFMGQYLKVSMEALEQNNFTLAEPFLDPDGLHYNEQKTYLAYLVEQGIQEDMLAVRVRQAIRVSPSVIWVQTSELYDITYRDRTEPKQHFVSEYLLVGADTGNYKVHRLLGTFNNKK